MVRIIFLVIPFILFAIGLYIGGMLAISGTVPPIRGVAPSGLHALQAAGIAVGSFGIGILVTKVFERVFKW